MPEDSTPPQPTSPAQPAPATAVPAPTPVLPTVPDAGYTADGVPTFDGVREKIETRYETALGSTELAEDTRQARAAAQDFESRHRAAEEKLAEIRASMHESD